GQSLPVDILPSLSEPVGEVVHELDVVGDLRLGPPVHRDVRVGQVGGSGVASVVLEQQISGHDLLLVRGSHCGHHHPWDGAAPPISTPVAGAVPRALARHPLEMRLPAGAHRRLPTGCASPASRPDRAGTHHTSSRPTRTRSAPGAGAKVSPARETPPRSKGWAKPADATMVIPTATSSVAGAARAVGGAAARLGSHSRKLSSRTSTAVTAPASTTHRSLCAHHRPVPGSGSGSPTPRSTP